MIMHEVLTRWFGDCCMEAAEVDEAVRAEEEVGDQRSDCVQVTWNINMIPNVKAFTERNTSDQLIWRRSRTHRWGWKPKLWWTWDSSHVEARCFSRNLSQRSQCRGRCYPCTNTVKIKQTTNKQKTLKILQSTLCWIKSIIPWSVWILDSDWLAGMQ